MRIDLHDGFYLDQIRDGDQPAYVEHFSDKDTADRLLKIPFPYTEAHADFWVKHCTNLARQETDPHQFALRRPDGFLIGGIGLVLDKGMADHRAETGYWVAIGYRGRGLATAAVQAITQHAFQRLDIKRIEAYPFSGNLESCRVLEKAGFMREGLLVGYHLKEGALIDAHLFARVEKAPTSLA